MKRFIQITKIRTRCMQCNCTGSIYEKVYHNQFTVITCPACKGEKYQIIEKSEDVTAEIAALRSRLHRIKLEKKKEKSI